MNNELYFKNVKELNISGMVVYPNLENFSIVDNIFTHTSGKKCNLGNTNLQYIDDSLYTLDEGDIFLIMYYISLMNNDPLYLDRKISQLNTLLSLDTLNNECYNFISSYLDDLHTRKRLDSKFSYAGASDEIDKLSEPVFSSYDETNKILFNKPAATYVRTLESKYCEGLFNKSKSFVRVHKSNNSVLNEDEYNNIAGFTSATLIITITCTIGIVIAIILYAINHL
ncbi:MAG: hypothetical protein R3Y13_04765 [bacterium]